MGVEVERRAEALDDGNGAAFAFGKAQRLGASPLPGKQVLRKAPSTTVTAFGSKAS